MVPPIHGDTTLLDYPEKWVGKSLEELVNSRLRLIRGIQKTNAAKVDGRFIEDLQEMAMSSKSTDSDLEFQKRTTPSVSHLQMKLHPSDLLERSNLQSFQELLLKDLLKKFSMTQI